MTMGAPSRFFRLATFAAALSMGGGAGGRAGGGDGAPASIVSLDFCADQLVLAFADRAQVKAVSRQATGPESFYADRALGLATLVGSAEEMLELRPDLVVRTWAGSPAGDMLAARVGIATFQPPYAMTLEDNFAVLESAAAALGHEAEGRAMADAYRARLKALKAASHSGLKAVYMTPSGFTAGVGTYVDDVIKLGGFDTIAADIGLNGWAPLPLEKMVQNPPDLVIGAFFDEGAVHVSAWASGRHGVYHRLLEGRPVIMVPSRYLSCSGAFFVDAAEYIRAEANRLGLITEEGQSR